ncbi:hypothetical protein J5X84_16895 [Streptosporangiaceae bacterium NEAU-GS5]|nr:hypothetical protein [Streptosporangiaceae bacterium NEAU-GS5]
MKFSGTTGRGGVLGLVLALIAAMGCFVLAPIAVAPALADTTEPSLIKYRNASDPEIETCSDPSSSWSGLCLYTSNDLGSPGPWYYPMDKTYLYTLNNGADPSNPDNWVDRGAVLNESAYSSWVPSGAKHMWAPSHGRYGGKDYLFVPDVTDPTSPGVSTTSRIGISSADHPWGPYTYQKTYAIGTYASDPDFFVDPVNNNPYMVYANGDYGNCGGISIAPLQTADITQLGTGPTELIINGAKDWFGAVGNCAAKNRPYIEGASLYSFDNAITGAGTSGRKFWLVMAVKPDGGFYGANNEVIAYATADNILGPYTYKGIIMDSSTTEWTNQASIAKFGDHFILAYHDGTACGDSDPRGCTNGTINGGFVRAPMRTAHAACLNFHNGGIQRIARTSNGFARCIHTKGTIALRSRGSGAVVSAANYGNNDLTANRQWVGGWEKFEMIPQPSGNFALRAHVNSKFVSENHGLGRLRADATTIGPLEQFSFEFRDDGSVRLHDFTDSLIKPDLDQNILGSWDPKTPIKSPDFDVVVMDGTIALRARINNSIVTAESGGASPLIANRSTIGAWEKFDVTNIPDYTAFRAQINSMYVCADNWGNNPLIANRSTAGDWESFLPYWNADGSFSFQAKVNSMYVTAESGGAASLIANRTSIGPWEKFDIIQVI